MIFSYNTISNLITWMFLLDIRYHIRLNMRRVRGLRQRIYFLMNLKKIGLNIIISANQKRKTITISVQFIVGFHCTSMCFIPLLLANWKGVLSKIFDHIYFQINWLLPTVLTMFQIGILGSVKLAQG